MPRHQNQSSLPRYQQVKETVRQYISLHGLRNGDRIPTEAEQCTLLGFSRVTISRAIKELEWEGVLERIQGSGTFVAAPKPQSISYRIMVCSYKLRRQDYYLNELFAGVREAAAKTGVDVVFYTESLVPTSDTVHQVKADGIFVIGCELDTLPQLLELSNSGIPAVGTALRSRVGEAPLVCSDNLDGVRQAIAHLHDLNHSAIAFVSSGLETSDVQERLFGYQQAMAEAGLAVNPSYILAGTETAVVKLIENWWDNLDYKPTAMLCSGWLTTKMMGILTKRGIRIPEDLSLIVMDDIPDAVLQDPPLTVISQPVYELGKRGIVKLMQMIKGKDEGRPEILPTTLIIRGSTAEAKSELS